MTEFVLLAMAYLAGLVSFYVATRYVPRKKQQIQHEPNTGVSCDLCWRGYQTEYDALQHVIDTHNAPDTETAQNSITSHN